MINYSKKQIRTLRVMRKSSDLFVLVNVSAAPLTIFLHRIILKTLQFLTTPPPRVTERSLSAVNLCIRTENTFFVIEQISAIATQHYLF